MRRELDSHGHGVNDPSQYDLNCAPGAVPLVQFLQGGWLAPKRAISGIQRTEDIINCMHQDLPHPAAVRVLLSKSQEIVNTKLLFVRVARGLARVEYRQQLSARHLCR